MLIGKGYRLSIYDGYVSQSGVVGANREYIEREIPHIWSLMRGSVREVVDSADVIVIGNGAREFREIEPSLRQDQVVVDLVRAFGPKTSDDDRYRGICW
jgi:GDP-mannose 6-dehydrogenase